MSSCGALMVMPAVVDSNTCSKEPSKRLTSVEVPPTKYDLDLNILIYILRIFYNLLSKAHTGREEPRAAQVVRA